MSANSRTKRDGGIDLSVKAKDNRYPIPVYLDDADEPAFTLRFNPGDPFVLDYANKLQGVDVPESSDADNVLEFISFTDKIEHYTDAIFGEGSARLIFRYDGPEHALLNAVLDKVREGYEDYKERAETADKATKAQAVIDARKEASQFIAPK